MTCKHDFEHEQLKEICDKIWYSTYMWQEEQNWPEIYIEKWFYKPWCRRCIYQKMDVREIIFTKEFMDKYLKFINIKEKINTSEWSLKFSIFLFNNLDNPVQYLYNLILWQKNKW